MRIERSLYHRDSNIPHTMAKGATCKERMAVVIHNRTSNEQAHPGPSDTLIRVWLSSTRQADDHPNHRRHFDQYRALQKLAENEQRVEEAQLKLSLMLQQGNTSKDSVLQNLVAQGDFSM